MKTKNIAVLSFLFASAIGKRHSKRLTLLPICLLLLYSAAFAQNLDDFRTAAAADGVKLIPFKDMQSEASKLAADVQRRKEDVQTYTYDTYASQKDNLLSENKKLTQEIETIEREKKEWSDKNPGAGTGSFDDQITRKKDEKASNDKKIGEINTRLKSGMEAFGALNEARARLREQFDRVIRELANAKSSPAKHLGESPSDEDKKKFENYISVIEDQIESQVEEHRKQEDGARTTRERYEQLLNKTQI